MMKNLYLILLLISISTYSFGQSFEWEILNIGIPSGFQKDKEGDVIECYDKGGAIGTEVRYNYLGKRLSSGIQLSFTGWNRRSPAYDYEFTNHQNPFMFLFVTDYNFLEINPNKIGFCRRLVNRIDLIKKTPDIIIGRSFLFLLLRDEKIVSY